MNPILRSIWHHFFDQEVWPQEHRDAGTCSCTCRPVTESIFAIDYRYERSSWRLTGRMLPEPQVKAPSHTAPSFQDNDSGDSVSVDSITLRTGLHTETWTLSYDDGRWRVEGSRSEIRSGTANGTNQIANWTQIGGEPTEGDQLCSKPTVASKSGIWVAPPLQMSAYGEHTLLINVWDDNIEQSAVIAFDMLGLEELGRWYGPAGTRSTAWPSQAALFGGFRTPLIIQLDINSPGCPSSRAQH